MLEVKRLRLAREWNQTELAFHAGLAPSVISEIENGKRDPSARTLRKLAEALEVDVAELFPKGQAPLPDLGGERRPPLRSWAAYIRRVADRWEAEIDRREAEWDAATPVIRKNVKQVLNRTWATEICGGANDIMAAATDELEAALGIATTPEALELFSALRRLSEVVGRVDPWFSSTGEAYNTARVIDFGETLERMGRKIESRAS